MHYGLRIGATLLMIAVIGACSGLQVNQDYDPSTDFGHYRTFAWAPEPSPGSGHVLIDSPLMDRRIRTAIERTLKSRGYPPAENGRPDFFVTYQLVVKSRIEVSTVGPAFGWGAYPFGYRGYPYGYWGYPYPYWGGIDYTTFVDQYDVGTLIIDLTDAKTNRLFWRGIGERRLSQQSTPEKTTEMVNRTVAEILAQYPPRPGK
jgi:hypothetical protein